jgi:hypothetical protein
MSNSLYMNVPLAPIKEDLEKGLIEEDSDEETGCVCTLEEWSYSGPYCRHFGTGYVIATVICCGGMTIALFLGFLHVLNVF